jgi:arylsulfatase A-like enzyme
MLAVAVAATLTGVSALAVLALRPGPEPLSPGTDLRGLLSDFGCEGCNVVLITVDTLRADFLPCYGYAKDTAPRICRFAERNLLFEHAYSGAPVTVPALVSLMTGSVVANAKPLQLIAHYEQRPALAELLAGEGYRTAGFTDHSAFRAGRGDLSKADLLLRGFQTFVNVGRGRDHRGSPELTGKVLDWLGAHRGERFFLWAHYFDPHWNYMPPPELEGRFGFDPARCGEIRNGIDVREVHKIEKALTNDEVACLIALHQAEIYFTDRHIGRVLDAIEDLGLADDTLVIITADHGEEFLERDRVGHEWTVYNELMHVPLVIRNPRRPLAGRFAEEISTVSVFDIVRGAVADHPIELGELVIGRAFHYYGKGAGDLSELRRRPNEFALFMGQHKLIITPETRRHELYDLEVDPKERNDLGLEQAKRSPLYGRLKRWLEENEVQPGPPSAGGVESQRELLERLQNLGYNREE